MVLQYIASEIEYSAPHYVTRLRLAGRHDGGRIVTAVVGLNRTRHLVDTNVRASLHPFDSALASVTVQDDDDDD